jgi:hypothetical protein
MRLWRVKRQLFRGRLWSEAHQIPSHKSRSAILLLPSATRSSSTIHPNFSIPSWRRILSGENMDVLALAISSASWIAVAAITCQLNCYSEF